MKLQHRLATEIVLASLCLAGPASTDLVYNVSVNTAAIKTTAGFLDFQFAPGLGSQAASVQVKSFAAPGGVLAGSPILSGEARGLLPATATLGNGILTSSAFNDYFEGFMFGDSLTFTLDFSGPAISVPNGAGGGTFGFTMFASDQSTPLLTNDPFGFAALLDVNPDGTATTRVFPSNNSGGAPVVTFAPLATVPEPSYLALLGLLFAGIGVSRRGCRD